MGERDALCHPPPRREGRPEASGWGSSGLSGTTPTPDPSPQRGGEQDALSGSPDEHKPQASLLPLFAWLSPSFPVGAYAYSHTLEWAAESGDVRDEASFGQWLRDLLELGIGRNDAILLAHAHRAAMEQTDALIAVNDLALALAPSQELRLETRQQGRSFLDAALAAWPTPRLEECVGAVSEEVAYPVAVGITAAAHDLPLSATLHAFIFAFAQNITSAAIRLAPIGQTAGSRLLATLMPHVTTIAREAEHAPLDDIGSATFRADLGSFHHETQYTRLFRS